MCPSVLLKRVLQLEGSGLSPFPPVAFLQSTVELAYVVFLLYDVYTMWGYENVINLRSAMSRQLKGEITIAPELLQEAQIQLPLQSAVPLWQRS